MWLKVHPHKCVLGPPQAQGLGDTKYQEPATADLWGTWWTEGGGHCLWQSVPSPNQTSFVTPFLGEGLYSVCVSVYGCLSVSTWSQTTGPQVWAGSWKDQQAWELVTGGTRGTKIAPGETMASGGCLLVKSYVWTCNLGRPVCLCMPMWGNWKTWGSRAQQLDRLVV